MPRPQEYSIDGYRESYHNTLKVMENEDVQIIAEGCIFLDPYIAIFPDFLVRDNDNNGAWHMVELKASRNITSVQVNDLAWQTFVLKEAGIDISLAQMMHPQYGSIEIAQDVQNGTYVPKREDFELISDWSDWALDPVDAPVPICLNTLIRYSDIVNADEPLDVQNIANTTLHQPIGKSEGCLSPYPCQFIEMCDRVDNP